MRTEDCPDELTLEVKLRRVSVNVCLVKTRPWDPTVSEDQAGVTLTYEVQLAKRRIEVDNLNAKESGLAVIKPLTVEVRCPNDVFVNASREDVDRLVLNAVELDLEEAIVDFIRAQGT